MPKSIRIKGQDLASESVKIINFCTADDFAAAGTENDVDKHAFRPAQQALLDNEGHASAGWEGVHCDGSIKRNGMVLCSGPG